MQDIHEILGRPKDVPPLQSNEEQRPAGTATQAMNPTSGLRGQVARLSWADPLDATTVEEALRDRGNESNHVQQHHVVDVRNGPPVTPPPTPAPTPTSASVDPVELPSPSPSPAITTTTTTTAHQNVRVRRKSSLGGGASLHDKFHMTSLSAMSSTGTATRLPILRQQRPSVVSPNPASPTTITTTTRATTNIHNNNNHTAPSSSAITTPIPITTNQRPVSSASGRISNVSAPSSPLLAPLPMSPHAKRLGDQLLLMEFELLDALEKTNAQRTSTSNTDRPSNASLKDWKRLSTSSPNGQHHSTFRMSPIHQHRVSAEFRSGEAGAPFNAPPNYRKRLEDSLNKNHEKLQVRLKEYYRQHRRITLCALLLPLLILLVIILTVSLTVPTWYIFIGFLRFSSLLLHSFPRSPLSQFLQYYSLLRLFLCLRIRGHHHHHLPSLPPPPAPPPPPPTLAPSSSPLGCRVPSLYDEIVAIISKPDGTALFSADELAAYPRLQQLTYFLGSTTSQSFGIKDPVSKDQFRLRKAFQAAHFPSLQDFNSFPFSQIPSRRVFVLGKPLCGRVDPLTPILGFYPSVGQRNIIRLRYPNRKISGEIQVSNWTDTSNHHDGNVKDGQSTSSDTQEFPINANVPDYSLAICCVDFFAVTEGGAKEEINADNDPNRRVPREKVDGRILCQSGRGIGGSWSGWSSMVPWAPMNDGSVRASDQQYVWPSYIATGWSRTPIGTENEGGAAILASSEEGDRIGMLFLSS